MPVLRVFFFFILLLSWVWDLDIRLCDLRQPDYRSFSLFFSHDRVSFLFSFTSDSLTFRRQQRNERFLCYSYFCPKRCFCFLLPISFGSLFCALNCLEKCKHKRVKKKNKGKTSREPITCIPWIWPGRQMSCFFLLSHCNLWLFLQTLVKRNRRRISQTSVWLLLHYFLSLTFRVSD